MPNTSLKKARHAMQPSSVVDWFGSQVPVDDFVGRRVLVIVPDTTRTAPLPLLFGGVYRRIGPVAESIDVIVALGTHPAMSESAIEEMLGLGDQVGEDKEGVSLTSLVKGDGKLDRDAIYWHFPHYSNHGMHSPGGAIRAGDYKLLEYFENNTVQLFNLKEDIGEQRDLAASQPAKAAELREMLHAWRTKVGARMQVPNPDYQPATSSP